MPEFNKVKELIEYLKQFDGELTICHTDHFGNPISIDVEERKLINGENVIEFTVRYIGEEPE